MGFQPLDGAGASHPEIRQRAVVPQQIPVGLLVQFRNAEDVYKRQDYCRVSCDVGLDWDDVWYMRLFHRERVSTKQAINNTVFRRQLNGRAYGSDPDVFLSLIHI